MSASQKQFRKPYSKDNHMEKRKFIGKACVCDSTDRYIDGVVREGKIATITVVCNACGNVEKRGWRDTDKNEKILF